MMHTTEITIGDLVREAPIRARIFEKLGIDFCCGGKKPLAEVCQAKGLDAATVLAMIEAVGNGADATLVDADAMSLSELCDHIEQAHHQYLRDELPRLDFMTRKVSAVHGDHEPRLIEIRQVFATFAPELAEHMCDEEEQVFPRIRDLESGQGLHDRATLRQAIDELEREHADAGSALARLRELTDGYRPPEWACNTFRALYDSLERLEKNMHQHVHKENNVLFPRALRTA